MADIQHALRLLKLNAWSIGLSGLSAFIGAINYIHFAEGWTRGIFTIIFIGLFGVCAYYLGQIRMDIREAKDLLKDIENAEV